MKEPLPQLKRDILVQLSVGSTSKEFLTSSASQNLNKLGVASPTASGMYTTLSTPRMGTPNLTRMKWVYHIPTPKKNKT